MISKKKNIVFIASLITIILMNCGCGDEAADTTPAAVTFESALQTGGTSGTADSTGLTLTFDVDPTTLAASDITVTGATKGALSGTGTTRSLAISDITVGNGETVSVAITSPSGFTLTGSPQTAVVYRAPTAVSFQSAVQTGGTSGTADSTGLTLTFDVDPTTLAASDITVTGATKGVLSGTGTTRSLAISNITIDDGETVSVAIASPSGYAISGSPRIADVHRKTYNPRDTGPAGGLIFYDKGNYSDGWRYLEAAPQSTEWTSRQWGKSETPVNGTGTAVGTGRNNSALIVALLNAAPADSDRAAQLCDALIHNGFTDWFLPSSDELNQMYVNLHLLGDGGFAVDGYYWSSSEHSGAYAWLQYFGNGYQTEDFKYSERRVRAARAF